ncbi:1243_t:CDS:2 [Gigaspora margarita]|uniref:1243_t:CDS:1 n=1 Tax=Gigaspora margarita TaxID=4874 RepID=A0ABN7VXG9_GIGMA|nr:1243_t:CDS:2 [Gigaspora margarita]
MRELLLVRKLEEENAKKTKQNDSPTTILPENTSNIDSHIENPSFPISMQETQEVHQDTHNITLNNNSEINLSSDGNMQNNPSINAVQIQTSVTGLNTDIQQQSSSLPDDNNSIFIPLENSTSNDVASSDKTVHPAELAENINDLTEEKKQYDTVLQTKRESLKEFFLQKQPYIHKDSYTNNLGLDPDFIETESQSSLSPISKLNTEDGLMVTLTESNSNLSKSENLSSDSSNHQIDSKLSPDERRQKAAANRDSQRNELKNLKKLKKRQFTEQKPDDDDIVIMVPQKNTTTVDKLEETPTVVVNSAESDEKTTITRIKYSKDKNSSADSDTDGSVDLDALIAAGSDLDSSAIQLNDDGLDDGDDSFWKIDPAELERHLSPSTTPLRRPSPDPQNTPTLVSLAMSNRPVSMIAEEEENLSDTPLEIDGQEADDILNTFSNPGGFDMELKNDDEEDQIDMSLDTQITPILKPVSPSPVPSPYPTLSGGKSGIPTGLPKTAFSPHFGPSPLSPTSSRASSVADPDEYETMSNGSYTSVRSAGSAKSGTSGIRKPSNTSGLRAPSRTGVHVTSPSRMAFPGRVDSHTSIPSPGRQRSLSVVSNSSTEESTTSSVDATSPSRIASPTRGVRIYSPMSHAITGGGTRPRSVSRISNSSAESSATNASTTGVRPLNKAGSNIGTPKISSISSGIPNRARNNNTEKNVSSARPVSQLQSPSSSSTGLSRTTNRTSLVKPPGSATSVRSFGGNTTETSKQSTIKKIRHQSQIVNDHDNSTFDLNATSGIRPPSRLRGSTITRIGSRQSSDSLSSHDDYIIFTPPESPTNASETDSLTSLTSSVSYGSSPGRGTSPIPPASMITSPTRISSKSSNRASMITPPSRISKLTYTRTTPSKLATPGSQAASQPN